jgi:hypothetical protein
MPQVQSTHRPDRVPPGKSAKAAPKHQRPIDEFQGKTVKELLKIAPLDGVDLTRDRSLHPPVEL